MLHAYNTFKRVLYVTLLADAYGLSRQDAFRELTIDLDLCVPSLFDLLPFKLFVLIGLEASQKFGNSSWLRYCKASGLGAGTFVRRVTVLSC